MKTNKRICGTYYETLAAEYLEGLGYCILERNFHAGRVGEIDLIAWDAEIDTLIFTEVKYRSSTVCGYPEEAVDRRKQKTIRHCACVYLNQHRQQRCRRVRFDVVSILGNGTITHYVNAF